MRHTYKRFMNKRSKTVWWVRDTFMSVDMSKENTPAEPCYWLCRVNGNQTKYVYQSDINKLYVEVE